MFVETNLQIPLMYITATTREPAATTVCWSPMSTNGAVFIDSQGDNLEYFLFLLSKVYFVE